MPGVPTRSADVSIEGRTPAVVWSEGPFEDNLREEAIEGDVANGEAFPSGMIVEIPPGDAVLPEATLAGDGSPLADE